jgi:hypothetical protein
MSKTYNTYTTTTKEGKQVIIIDLTNLLPYEQDAIRKFTRPHKLPTIYMDQNGEHLIEPNALFLDEGNINLKSKKIKDTLIVPEK